MSFKHWCFVILAVPFAMVLGILGCLFFGRKNTQHILNMASDGLGKLQS